MAQLFDDVFNSKSIHEMLFFNLRSVLIHSTLLVLEKENKPMFERWSYLAKTKHKFDIKTVHDNADAMIDAQRVYEQYAPYYPEFSRINAITYATVYMENGKLKRYMKKIVNEDEFIVLATFTEELYQLSSDGIKSSPQYFPILCGHNILRYDIPHFVKKHVLYKDRFEKGLPLIIKKNLDVKPWESGVIDTVNVWKFNGYDYMPLMLISDFLGLKKTVDLLPLDEVSKQYWEMVSTDEEKALEFVSLQSATQTNLVIQLMNRLRQL